MKEFVLSNSNGVRMRISEYGGVVREINVPDREGVSEDIVLGFDSMEAYEAVRPTLGQLDGSGINAKGIELDGVVTS